MTGLLLRLILIPLILLPLYGDKITPVEEQQTFTSGYRIYIDTLIEDHNITETRLYFRTAASPRYEAFTRMECIGKYCRGIIPSPAGSTETIYYTILYKKTNNRIYTGKESVITRRNGLYLVNQTKERTPLRLRTEQTQKPLLAGFEDRYSIQEIANSRKYGVVAGLITRDKAGIEDTSVIEGRRATIFTDLPPAAYAAAAVLLMALAI